MTLKEKIRERRLVFIKKKKKKLKTNEEVSNCNLDPRIKNSNMIDNMHNNNNNENASIEQFFKDNLISNNNNNDFETLDDLFNVYK